MSTKSNSIVNLSKAPMIFIGPDTATLSDIDRAENICEACMKDIANGSHSLQSHILAYTDSDPVLTHLTSCGTCPKVAEGAFWYEVYLAEVVDVSLGLLIAIDQWSQSGNSHRANLATELYSKVEELKEKV